jgi:hypothetical protein
MGNVLPGNSTRLFAYNVFGGSVCQDSITDWLAIRPIHNMEEKAHWGSTNDGFHWDGKLRAQ